MTSGLDEDEQAVPPQWPPSAHNLVVDDGVYELTVVPVTSIALVTSRMLKVMRPWQIWCDAPSLIVIDRYRTNIGRPLEVSHDERNYTTWGPRKRMGRQRSRSGGGLGAHSFN